MIRFKDWATAKGFLDLQFKKVSPIHRTTLGACAPNGIGDSQHFTKLRAKVVRVPNEKAVEFSHSSDLPYMVTIGDTKDHPQVIANNIDSLERQIDADHMPIFWLVANEDPAMTEEFVREVRYHYLEMNPGRYRFASQIVKAAWPACVESDGMHLYDELFKSDKELESVHFLHFYLKPSWEPDAFFENWKRKCRLAYIVDQLRIRGVKKIHIDEFHAASNKKEGYPDQGEQVYNDWKTHRACVDLFDLLDIGLALYYQCPYNSYPGNDESNLM